MKGLRVVAKGLEGLTGPEAERVAAQLAEVEAAFKQNPLLGYYPHPKQSAFHVLPHPPLRAFFGGNRSGKTTATMVDSIIQAVDLEVVPERLRVFRRWDDTFFCRVITPDLTNTLEGVVLQKFREWCPRGQLKGGSFERAYDKVQRMLWLKNGNWFQFFSNDQDLDKFGGAALHRIVYDEEPREDLRRECLMRLIDYGGEEVFGMTPLHGMSWVFDEIYEPWERGVLPEDSGRVVVVDMEDNPHLDRVTMKRVLAGLSDEERQSRKSGRFVSFSGLIFPMFQSQTHVLPLEDLCPLREVREGDRCWEEFLPPAGVEVMCGIDPGYRHMCAVVFCYLDSLDRLVVFDEIALQKTTVRDVCTEIRKRCLRWRITPNWFVVDPAAQNKNNQTGRSDQTEFADNGIVTIPGQNAVGAGINRMKERLSVRGRDGALTPRLVVSAHCHELRGEFKRYRWAKDSTRREDAAKEAPVKKDDHLLDALRYVVMQRPLAPDPELMLPTLTMKDRLLRGHLKRLRLGGQGGRLVDHPSGSGVFT